MTATAISTSTWSPKYPETFAAIRDKHTYGGGVHTARVLWQEESYGYHYDLYGVINGDSGRLVGSFIVAPVGHLFLAWLGEDTGTAISNFQYICQRVTMQQYGWADQGKLSCPIQSMKDFLMKHQVFHCDGRCLDGKLNMDDGTWHGLRQLPSFPRIA